MKTIQVVNCTSTELVAAFDVVRSVEIEDRSFNEGAFGDLYHCISINGRPSLPRQVIKVLKADSEGNDARGFATIQKLQGRIRRKNSELRLAGRRTITDFPGLYALPQFSYEGQLGNRRVLGYSANWLDPGRFHNFAEVGDDLGLLNEYLRLDLNARLQCALDLAELFSVLREIQYIHVDINPQNLFLSFDDGHLVVIDYDSGAVVEKPDDSPTTYGKPNEWLAPEVAEQLIGNNNLVKVDLFTDTWAVAVGVHYLIFGLFPFFFLKDFSLNTAGTYLSRYRWPQIDFGDSNAVPQSKKKYQQYRTQLEQHEKIKNLRRAFDVTFNEGVLKPDRRMSYGQWVQLIQPLVRPIPFAPPTVAVPPPRSPTPPLQQAPTVGTGIATSAMQHSAATSLTPTRTPTLSLRKLKSALRWTGVLVGGSIGHLVNVWLSGEQTSQSVVVVASVTAVSATFIKVWPGRNFKECLVVVGCLILASFLFPLILSPLAWAITYSALLGLAAPRLFLLYQKKGWQTALKACGAGALTVATAILLAGTNFPTRERLQPGDAAVAPAHIQPGIAKPTPRARPVATSPSLDQSRTLSVDQAARIDAVAFSSNGQFVAAADTQGRLHLWDVPSGRLVKTVTDAPDGLKALAFVPGSTRLITQGTSLRIWEFPGGKVVARLPGQEWGVRIAVSPDGRRLATFNGGGNLQVWDIATLKQVLNRRFTGGFSSVAFSPDGNSIALKSGQDTVSLLSLSSSDERRIQGPEECVGLAVNVSPDGKSLAAAGSGAICLWDVESGRLRWKKDELIRTGPAAGMAQSFVGIGFFSDGLHLYALPQHGPLLIVRTKDGIERRTIDAVLPGSLVTGVALSFKDTWLAVSQDNRVGLWSPGLSQASAPASASNVEALLSAAAQDLRNDRLSGALKKYEEVTRLRDGNPEDSNVEMARVGLQEIVDRLLELTNKVIDENRLDDADRYLARASNIKNTDQLQVTATAEKVKLLRQQVSPTQRTGVGGPGPDLSTAEQNGQASANLFDGIYFSEDGSWGFQISGNEGVAVKSNNPNYKVGDVMLRFHRAADKKFEGEQLCTDGRFHRVIGKLVDNGSIEMSIEDCSYSPYTMQRVKPVTKTNDGAAGSGIYAD